MTASLFNRLDLDGDGFLSRRELYDAATAMGLGWYEAPLFALLDLFTIPGPMPRDRFTSCWHAITADPMGPYGPVLQQTPLFHGHRDQRRLKFPLSAARSAGSRSSGRATRASGASDDGMPAIDLDGLADSDVRENYRHLVEAQGAVDLQCDSVAALMIDPQRSFTSGAWMHSIGARAVADVTPIGQAFANCAAWLARYYDALEVMFTRCPFPPASYVWDAQLEGVIDPAQLYFIKPGNSALFPSYNGFRDWVACCIKAGRKTLLVGGCTLNSCVRVSAIETQQAFREQHLQVVVDLSLCGARLRNYIPDVQFNGVSAVASAVRQMVAAGVKVVRQVNWR